MAKLIWILPGIALGGAGAMLATMAWPMLGLEDSLVAVSVSAIAVGLVLFYAVAFAAAALAEAAEIAAANRRLAELGRDAHGGAPTEPAMLYEALSGTWLGAFAVGYVSSLRDAGKDKRFVGPDPAQSFPIAALIEDRLTAGLFCRFGEVFIVLALIALLLGGAFIVADGLSSVTMLAELEAVLVATSASLAGAAIVWLTQPALLGLCHAQVRRFILQLRSLFATDDGGGEAHRVAESIGALRRELGDLLVRTEASLERDNEAIARIADGHATILTKSFARVLTDLERRLDLVAEKSVAAFSQALDREFGGVDRHAALAAEARDAFRAACGQLETLGKNLAEQASQQAQSAGVTAERVLTGFEGGLDRLSDSVFGQASGELRVAAGTMRQLYESVDALCLSVAPVLNRLVDTQDALLSHLPQEGHLAQLMAEVTADLKQLSKAQRETVERHIQLASELARVSLNLGQGAASKVEGTANGSHRGQDLIAEHRSRGSAGAHDVIAALRELRSEADEAERHGPRIEA